ncbi:MAG TPA: DUF1571 domain-containing protein, partial [Planctomycetia bacterium]|nr:DUF1571 domain-containing protein [Planctomycetia bacterium]
GPIQPAASNKGPGDAVRPATGATATSIVERAAEFYRKTPNYTCRLVRQERLGFTLQPAERILIHARRKPRSIYYKWVGEVNAGRESIYVENKNGGKIVTRGGKSDFPFSGKRIEVGPNDLLARSRSRYPITETFQDVLIGKLADATRKAEAGDFSLGNVVYQGPVKKDEFPQPVELVVQELPVKFDACFPKGGVREWHFDPETGRLLWLRGVDDRKQLVEHYLFEHLFANDALSESDFEPDLVWPAKGAATASANLPK